MRDWRVDVPEKYIVSASRSDLEWLQEHIYGIDAEWTELRDLWVTRYTGRGQAPAGLVALARGELAAFRAMSGE